MQIRRGVLCFADFGELINKPYDVRTIHRFGKDDFGVRESLGRVPTTPAARLIDWPNRDGFFFNQVIGK